MIRATFIFVHGAFHGAWCWRKPSLLLKELGHCVRVVDLPRPTDGGLDATALLEAWTDRVIEEVHACSQKVILVGHSRSGIVISQVAELIPGRIARLVYCAAMLVNDCETMEDTRHRLGEPLQTPLRIRRDGGSDFLIADAASVASVIYNASSPADAAFAIRQLRPEPYAGFGIAPRLTPSRYGSVPRATIECTLDSVISPALQRGMRASQPCDLVETLRCDHAPYLSDSAGLSAALDRIASRTPTPAPLTRISGA